MNGDMHKTKARVLLFRSALCCLLFHLRERGKDWHDDVFRLYSVWRFCFRLKVPIVFAFIPVRAFCLHRKPTDPSAPKPSSPRESNRDRNLKTTHLIPLLRQNVSFMNESVFPAVSRRESSSYICLASIPKQPICPRRFSKPSSSHETGEVSPGRRSTILSSGFLDEREKASLL